MQHEFPACSPRPVGSCGRGPAGRSCHGAPSPVRHAPALAQIPGAVTSRTHLRDALRRQRWTALRGSTPAPTDEYCAYHGCERDRQEQDLLQPGGPQETRHRPRPELLQVRHVLVPGKPRKCPKQRCQPWIGAAQPPFHSVEDPLLADGQAHDRDRLARLRQRRPGRVGATDEPVTVMAAGRTTSHERAPPPGHAIAVRGRSLDGSRSPIAMKRLPLLARGVATAPPRESERCGEHRWERLLWAPPPLGSWGG